MELRPEDFDLYRMLLGLEEMFRLRAEERGLALILERAPEVPQYVRADQNKLRQVLINLLGNAVKFTHRGSVTLRATTSLPAASAGGATAAMESRPTRLHFAVADTGVGIAPDELNKVFEAFMQTTSGQQSKQGTGLGMPLSRQYVQMMGGELVVSSELGQGATFSFDIQVELVENLATVEMQVARRVIGLSADQPTYKILVVEDVEPSRKLLVQLLEPLGFEVRTAANGQEAVTVWETWQPHLIWMDMGMPIMDGREATRRIRAACAANPDYPAPVIIALTASAFEEERGEILATGCDEFMYKPFKEADLFEAMRHHLGVRYVYEEGAAAGIAPLDEALTAAPLAKLPATVLEQLEYVVVRSQLKAIYVLIEEIREYDVAAADALTRLMDEFAYDEIMTLIRAALPQ